MVSEVAALPRSQTEGFKAVSIGVIERPQSLETVRTSPFTLLPGEMIMGHVVSDTKVAFTPQSDGWGFIGVDPEGNVHAMDSWDVSSKITTGEAVPGQTKIDPADVIHRPSITVAKGWTAIWFADENRGELTIEQRQIGEPLVVLDEESIYAGDLLPKRVEDLMNLGQRDREKYDVDTLTPNVPYKLPLSDSGK